MFHTPSSFHSFSNHVQIPASGWTHFAAQGLNESLAFSSVQFSSVAQSCLPLCNPMDCSTPGFPVHHQLLEHTQTHAHQVGDIIQTSYPLWSPSPPTFNLSQHQGLFFQGVSSSHPGGQSIGVSASASVFPMNIQD